jgi:hypothetical protein
MFDLSKSQTSKEELAINADRGLLGSCAGYGENCECGNGFIIVEGTGT